MRAFADLAKARHSVRGFLPRTIPRETVMGLLETARLAPSGANLQPGYFDALIGAPLAALCAHLAQVEAAGTAPHCEYSYFPDPMPPVLKERQRAAGYALYSALGVERRDIAGRQAQFSRNYQFFGAPVGIVVSIDRCLGAGSYMDLGMVLQTFMLAAEDLGLATCGIGALANYGAQVAQHLALPAERLVVCGLALGYPDPDHPANATRTRRAPLPEYASLHGFEEA